MRFIERWIPEIWAGCHRSSAGFWKCALDVAHRALDSGNLGWVSPIEGWILEMCARCRASSAGFRTSWLDLRIDHWILESFARRPRHEIRVLVTLGGAMIITYIPGTVSL